jgi:hypothetical protein
VQKGIGFRSATPLPLLVTSDKGQGTSGLLILFWWCLCFVLVKEIGKVDDYQIEFQTTTVTTGYF